ncbi:MAG: YceI family protein [Rhodobacter sp.]|nr:YceI family protein [Rhodobacter sp.]
MAQDLPAPIAGQYTLERAHSRLLFKVNHLGFSTYMAPFTDLAATLAFDPANPAAMTVSATIKAASVETLSPTPTSTSTPRSPAPTCWMPPNSPSSPSPPPPSP